MPVHHITDNADFQSQLIVAGSKLVVVQFTAPWSEPCKMITPVLEQLAAEYFEKVIFLKVDVDECVDIVTEYCICGPPAFIFFKDGEKVEEWTDSDPQKLKELFFKHSSE